MNEKQVQQLFRELKAQDAQRAPGFARLVVRSASEPVGMPWLRLAGALAAVVVLAAWWLWSRPPAVDVTQWAQLSNWRASSDSFLPTTSTPWGESVTTKSDAWFQDTATSKETL